MGDKTFKEIKDSTVQASGDTLARTLAFNGQCFLIQSMFEIAARAEAQGIVPHIVESLRAGDPHHPPPHLQSSFPPTPSTVVAGPAGSDSEIVTDQAAAGRQGQDAAMSGYLNLAPIISTDPEGPSTSYSAIIRKKNAAKLLDISTDLMSLLVPKIRLYKVEYASKDDPNEEGRLIPDRDQPPVEREVIFDDFIDPGDLTDIFRDRKGRVSGTGIKSFQWALKGVNPADVDANITAQLKIHFNDVGDIFTDQFRKPLDQQKAGRKGKVSFLDLIIYAPQRKVDQASGYTLSDDEPLYMLYDGVFFEIKAVVGWAIPPAAKGMLSADRPWRDCGGVGEPRCTDGPPQESELEVFQDAIRNSQTILFLQLVTHRFDFNQDGTATLVVNYRARYDNKKDEDNLFTAEPPGKKLSDAYHKILQRRKRRPALFETNKDGDDSESTEELKESQKKLEINLSKRYSRLIDALLGNPDESEFSGPVASGHPNPLYQPCRLYAVKATPLQLGAVKPRAGASSGAAAIEGATEKEFYDGLRHDKNDRLLRTSFGHERGKAAGFAEGGARASLDLAWAEHRDVQEMAFSSHGDSTTGTHSVQVGTRSRADFLNNYFTVGRIRKFIPDSDWRKSIEDYVEQRATTEAEEDDVVGLADIAMTHSRTDWQRARSGSGRGGRGGYGTRAVRRPDTSPGAERSTDVTFFFLGDLIDIAIGLTGTSDTKPGYRDEVYYGTEAYITTDIEFFNVKRFFTLANDVVNASDNNIGTPDVFFSRLRHGRLSLDAQQKKDLFLPINIASIPIEFNYFLEWYTRAVVSQKKEFYFLNNFITDVITQVVQPALSSKCFYGLPPQQTHLAMIDFMTDRNANLGGFLFPNTQVVDFGHPVLPAQGPPLQTDVHYAALRFGSVSATQQYLEKMRYLPAQCTESPNPPRGMPAYENEEISGAPRGGHKKYINYKVLTLTTTHPDLLPGDPYDDRQRGIYHFVVGAASGLLKKATFSRMDAPYLREARINRDRVAGAEQLRELYNVTLSLFGAPIIKPGQLIYVSPSPLGFGDPRSINSAARYLGIGGYHLVTSVESTIDNSGYSTIVKALHQGMPMAQAEPGLVARAKDARDRSSMEERRWLEEFGTPMSPGLRGQLR